MRRVGVYTQDFKFYRDVIDLLRRWGIPFVSLEHPHAFSGDVVIVLSSFKDPDYGSLQERFYNPRKAVRFAFARLLGKSAFSMVVVGIDPGPRPGLAVVCDGVLTEATECPGIDVLAAEVGDILNHYLYRDVVVRIGNGDRPNREAIISSLKGLNVLTYQVDESGTTIKYRNENNAISAAKIAMAVALPDGAGRKQKKRANFVERNFITIRGVLGA
ncbi:MAG: hypothetical protein M1410_03110 [Candidatus Thermoplasmatota archaeon]|nr:hypothetical protein [Candidatus Thermoplasmatota archaeon]